MIVDSGQWTVEESLRDNIIQATFDSFFNKTSQIWYSVSFIIHPDTTYIHPDTEEETEKEIDHIQKQSRGGGCFIYGFRI